MRSQFYTIVYALFLLLLGWGDGHILQRANEDSPSTVFRGDMRSPDILRTEGGSWCKGLKYTEELTAAEQNKAYSLFFHHEGVTKDYTRYVSTTTEPRIAKDFATNINTGEYGYVYRISTDPKMIDVVKTLKPDNMISKYVEQSEYAVLEGVPWQQIEGWYKASALTPEHIEKLKNGEKIEELFEANPDFDSKYLAMRSSGAQHQLAGFGKRKTGIPRPGLPKKSLRKIPPFDKFDHDKLEPYYKKTLEEVAPDLKLPNICKRGGSGCVELIREEQVFVKADPLGVRDLTGRLQVGEAGEGLVNVDIIEANNVAEATVAMEATEATEALEGFESAEALEAGEALEALEIVELEAEAAFFEEILAWAFLLLG
ncbi:hypothetical protein NHJ13734_008107 [Beauveria thailandica]